MSKSVAIVYWTGTGNTEEMAHALESGVVAAGAEGPRRARRGLLGR